MSVISLKEHKRQAQQRPETQLGELQLSSTMECKYEYPYDFPNSILQNCLVVREKKTNKQLYTFAFNTKKIKLKLTNHKKYNAIRTFSFNIIYLYIHHTYVITTRDCYNFLPPLNITNPPICEY